MSSPSPAYQVHIGSRIVRCHTLDERRLLLDAVVIADDPSEAKHFSIGRLVLMKEVCQLYCEGRLQRVLDQAIRNIHD